MKAWILNIGDEVLRGRIENKNAAFLGRELTKLGILPVKCAVVGDDPEMIGKILEAFRKDDSEILITTGGLGPTHDDITKEAVFGFLGLETELRKEHMGKLEAHFGGSFPDTNLRQLYFPKEALLLENKLGTAPGAIVEQGGKTYILLVGPFREMEAMFRAQVLPFLRKLSGEDEFVNEFIAMGKGESEFEEYLGGLYRSHPEVNFASYPEEGQIRFVLRSKDARAHREALSEFRELMRDYIISEEGESIEGAVVALLKAGGLRVSVAESCTGGMLASMLVNVPGASAVFEEGFVTYSDGAKMKYLGVREGTLAEYGAVSEAIVLEMIAGLRRLNGAEVRIAVSGIAGPGGGTPEKPVGLVHYAIGIEDDAFSEAKTFKGNREQIRRKTCLWVLYRLHSLLKERLGSKT
ncbi:MAG: nicotinamide-nucleotide amidohydrolase family protein [Bacilli bacterium]|jgi:nicotinamide-nucleotide amidase|nr:nicotinamide-nucleotide amidohydrolase family protein [Acholeplasmataceae bacterium]